MKARIVIQLLFCLKSFLAGFLIMALYDFIRLWRHILRHRAIGIAVEDILYFALCGCYIFYTFYEYNNGIIRGYALFFLVIGGILYHRLCSGPFLYLLIRIYDFIQDKAVRIIRFVMKPLRKLIHIGKKQQEKYRKILAERRERRRKRMQERKKQQEEKRGKGSRKKGKRKERKRKRSKKKKLRHSPKNENKDL